MRERFQSLMKCATERDRVLTVTMNIACLRHSAFANSPFALFGKMTHVNPVATAPGSRFVRPEEPGRYRSRF